MYGSNGYRMARDTYKQPLKINHCRIPLQSAIVDGTNPAFEETHLLSSLMSKGVKTLIYRLVLRSAGRQSYSWFSVGCT